jgi:hypothetical protein
MMAQRRRVDRLKTLSFQPEYLRISLLTIISFVVLRTFFDTYPLYNPAQFIFQCFFGIIFLLLISVIFLTLNFVEKQQLIDRVGILIVLTIFIVTNMLSIWYRVSVPQMPLHDGATQIEYSYQLLKHGENPYEADFSPLFADPHAPARTHFVYSPAVLYMSVPIFWISEKTINHIDLRMVLAISLLISGILLMSFVNDKLLFSLLFFLNPIFLPFIWYGANDSLVLLWISLSLVSLLKNKYSLATIFMAIATATKIIALPFFPIYLVYVYLRSKKNWKFLFGQFALFISVNLILYGPFLIKNSSSLISDILLYSLGGSNDTHHIAGVGGIQLLSSLGLVNANTSFPFYLISLVALFSVIFLAVIVLKKRTTVATLSLTFVICFLLLFSVTKIVQTNYLGFISQFLVIGTFLHQNEYD